MVDIEYNPHYLQYNISFKKTLPIHLKKGPHQILGGIFSAISILALVFSIRVIAPTVVAFIDFGVEAVQKGAVVYSGDLSFSVFGVLILPLVAVFISLLCFSSSSIHIKKGIIEFEHLRLAFFKKEWREAPVAFAKIEVVREDQSSSETGKLPVPEYKVWLRHETDTDKNLAVFVGPERMIANENARALAHLLDRPLELAKR